MALRSANTKARRCDECGALGSADCLCFECAGRRARGLSDTGAVVVLCASCKAAHDRRERERKRITSTVGL